MVATIVAALLALPLYLVYKIIAGLRKNIARAKATGLRYQILPLHWHSPVYALTGPLWLRCLRLLPAEWSEDIICFLTPDWQWKFGCRPFDKFGDTFVIITPGTFTTFTSDADVIRQVSQRRDAFPKPIHTYILLDIFGRNVVTTEGSEWKAHRKIAAPGFNERNNALVFKESVAQAQGMLTKWLGPDGKGSASLNEVPKDTMRVALHIISFVGFGIRLLWPSESAAGAKGHAFSSDQPAPGYTMSYEDALATLLDKILLFALMPMWMIRNLPIKSIQRFWESYINWGKYMQQLFEEKKAAETDSLRSEGMDIMGSLVRSSYENGKPKIDPRRLAGEKEQGKTGLKDSEILGNAFVMLLAGHETTANTIHFCLVYLSMCASSQRTLQREIETFFRDEPPEKWSYESSLNFLLGGMVGAVLNECLRVIPPVVSVPKGVSKDQDQTVLIDGKQHTLPKGTALMLSVLTVQRSEKYWPSTGPSKISGKHHDLDDFVPERWLLKDGQTRNETEAVREEDYGGYTGTDVSASLFRPESGAYLPFSVGQRSCLGRRIAQIEVAVILATLFQRYSIELAVDQWASDEEVAKMSDDEKRALYNTAAANARSKLREAFSIITLKLHSGSIPLRIVKKGEERFLPLFG